MKNNVKLNIKRYIKLATATAALCLAASLLADRIYPPPTAVEAMRVDSSAYGGVLVVPYNAVRQDDSGCEFVYIISGDISDGQAEKRNIITAAEYEDGFEIAEGIEDKAVVVLNPDDLSGERARVKPKR